MGGGKKKKSKPAIFGPNTLWNSEFVMECTALRPKWAVVLGSGFSGVAARLEKWAAFPYEMLRGIPAAGVEGHEGRLVVGLLGGTAVAVFSGRPHPYETGSFDASLEHVRLATAIGVEKIVLTNAAGGLDPRFAAGDLMVISDHINLMPASFGVLAPGAGGEPVYDGELGGRLASLCAVRGARCFRGVYAGLSGPTYETPAEIKWLKKIGADAVGMSTVHEATEARRLGMCVLGVSCISNVVGPAMESGPTHEEVLRNTARAAEIFADALYEMVGSK